jgi:predicted DNA-binding transcriptional regulator YafY
MRYEGRAQIVRRLAAVLLYTNTARCQPSLATMARGLGVSERTIRRDLDALIEAGWPMPSGVTTATAASTMVGTRARRTT